MLFVLRAVIKRGARQMVVCKMVVKPIAITKMVITSHMP